MSDVTRILSPIEQGDPQAAALVHDAYFRLVGAADERRTRRRQQSLEWLRAEVAELLKKAGDRN